MPTRRELETSVFYHLTNVRSAQRTKQGEGNPGANDLVWKSPNADRNEVGEDRKKIDAMGDWLLKLTPWDWFATLTFNRIVSVNGAHYWFKRYVEWAEKASGVPVRAFRADEYGPLHGRLHIHALMGNVTLGPLFEQGSLLAFCGERLPPGQTGRTCCATHAWLCGYARVFPFDVDKGASYYVSKYVVKANGDWELIGF